MAIVIPIIAEFKDKGLADAKKGFSEATSSFDKAASAASSMAKPAAAVVSGLAAAGIKVAKEAAGAAKQNQILGDSLKAVGYPETTKANIAYADSLAATIGVQDEEIKATMGMLSAFDATASSSDMMARVVTSGADMAAKGFGTMDSSAKLLGKALSDPIKGINALFRSGVTFTDQQKEQIKVMQESGDMAGAQALMMKQVEDTFGGAAAAGATMGDKLKIAFGEVAEALGAVLLPMLVKLPPILMKVAAWMQENADKLMKAAAAVGALSVAIVAINIGFKVYAAAMKVATVATKAFGLALKLAKGPVAWIATAIVAAAVLIIKNWDKVKDVTIKVWNAIKNQLQTTWNWIKSVVKSTFDFVKKIIDTAWRAVKAVFKLNPFVIVLTHLDWIKAKVKAAFDWVVQKVKDAWAKIKGIFTTNPFDKINGFLETMKGWFTSTFDWIGGKIDAFVQKVNGMVDKVQGAFTKAKSIADRIKPGKSAPADSAAALALPVTASMLNGLPVPTAGAVPVAQGGGGPTINVYGALDPEGVARQIRHLLDSHDRRQGKAVLRAVAF